MNPPPFQVRLLGSRPVVIASALGTLSLGAVAAQVTGAWPLAAIALGTAIAAGNAELKVRTYQVWQRDWDALGGNGGGRRKRRGTSWPIVVGIVLVALVLSVPHDTQVGMLGIATLLAPLLGLGWIIRRFFRRRRFRKANVIHAVTVCAGTGAYPVPPLPQMFAALPEHCQRILARSRS